MIDETVTEIREAIINTRQIVFVYRDSAGEETTRSVCPHMLGWKNGEWSVLGWQVSDDSKKGFGPGDPRWRCFKVRRIGHVLVTGEDWHRGWVTGDGEQTCIDDIDTVVDQSHAALVKSAVG